MSPASARAVGLRGAGSSSLAESVVSARSLLLASPAAPAPDAGPSTGALPGPDTALAPWPVPPALVSLLPGGGLRRGSTVRVEGSTSLLLALLAEASGAGAWCGAVGMESLGVVAAAEAGVDLDRLALVPRPRETWPTVVAALLDAVDVVVVAPPAAAPNARPAGSAGASLAWPSGSTGAGSTGPVQQRVTASVARRLSTRARERRAVLIVVGAASAWASADVELTVVDRRWDGLGAGHGHLSERSLEVRASGRRIGGHPRTALLLLQERSFHANRPRNGAVHPTSLPPRPRAGAS